MTSIKQATRINFNKTDYEFMATILDNEIQTVLDNTGGWDFADALEWTCGLNEQDNREHYEYFTWIGRDNLDGMGFYLKEGLEEIMEHFEKLNKIQKKFIKKMGGKGRFSNIMEDVMRDWNIHFRRSSKKR